MIFQVSNRPHTDRAMKGGHNNIELKFSGNFLPQQLAPSFGCHSRLHKTTHSMVYKGHLYKGHMKLSAKIKGQSIVS